MKFKLIFIPLILLIISCSNEGEPISSFSLKTLDGKTITNQDLKGKIVVIDVWATWCHNCVNELSELNKLANKYKGDNEVLLLAVSDESIDKVNSFISKRTFNFTQIPLGNDLTDALQTRFVKTYPQHIILGKDSKIAYESSGELSNASELLSMEIETLRSK